MKVEADPFIHSSIQSFSFGVSLEAGTACIQWQVRRKILVVVLEVEKQEGQARAGQEQRVEPEVEKLELQLSPHNVRDDDPAAPPKPYTWNM